MDTADFSADGIRAMLARKAEAKAAEEREHQAQVAAHHAAMHAAFEQQDLPPDALARVMHLVQKAIDRGEKEALVFRFPSEFMKDSGRSLTSHYGDWHTQLTGAAARAYGFYRRELAPRGFTLRAGILDYPDGIPGDAGFFLGWHQDEA